MSCGGISFWIDKISTEREQQIIDDNRVLTLKFISGGIDNSGGVTASKHVSSDKHVNSELHLAQIVLAGSCLVACTLPH
jgi:hypothetical protein